MSRFVGRERELAVLEKAYCSRQGELVPVYGRRRVGKSELILQFMRGKKGLYFLGKEAPAPLQLKEFMEEAALALEEPLLAELSVESWSRALNLVTDRLAPGHKFVLTFDEFQWAAAASPELPSVLQELWDRRWKRDGKVLVILCGSYVGFMEKEVLGRKSPLFGRRTAQILLRPFDYAEAALFHPSYAPEEQARTYFVCGGVPLYLEYFLPERSVEMNIRECILEQYSSLFREPDFLLREELRDVSNYYAVLLAVAAGAGSIKRIAAQSRVPERSLPYYLGQLVDLGYVGRHHPLSGRPSTRNQVRYRLEDPLLRFWFRFVYPNVSALVRTGSARTFEERVRPNLDAYFGMCFERLCRETLPWLYETEGVSGEARVGEYWNVATQIDVVGVREDGWVDLGECKWGTVRSARRVAEELEEKVGRFPNPDNATIAKRIFTRRRVKKIPSEPKGYHWHCLEDLYEAHP